MLKNIKLKLIPNFLIGFYYYKNRRYDISEGIFSKLITKQPDNAYLNFRYGMSLYKNKKWDDACYYIQKAVSMSPDQEGWKVQLATTERHIRNQSKSNFIDAKKNMENNPFSLDAIWEYAVSLFENKQYWMAKLQFQKYLNEKPDSERCLEKLAMVAEKLSDYEEAIKYFSQVSEYSPLNSTYKYYIGYCYEKLGNIEKAQCYYQLVFELSKLNKEIAAFGIGALHAKRGLWDFALKAYIQFLETNITTEKAELYYRIGLANERLYNWLDSAKAFEKALELSSVINADWCFKCGQSYERAECYEHASKYYREAVIRSSDYKDYWYYRLSFVLEKMGDVEQSLLYYKESRRRKYPHAISPKIIGNREEEYLSYYTEYYESLETDENIILLESFFGSSISCNPYAILLYLINNNNNFKYIVVIQPNTKIPDTLKFKKNIIFINRGSDAYLRYLCTAKYLINNVTFPYYFIRKEDQIYLNTWHGTPMKTLGKDIKNPFQDHANVSRNFLQATHIISPNRHTTNIILNRYDIRDLFSGKLAEIGYPRIDLSINLTEQRRREISEKLRFDNSKPVVFYAPTWRGTSQSKDFDIEKLKKDLIQLKSNKYNLLFRGHHLVEELLKKIDLNVTVAPKDIDSNELLGYCNILISDYSSIIYDFISLGKHAISYIYDFEEYKAERGLYFNKDDMVGDICSTIDEVKKSIAKGVSDRHSNVSQRDIKKYSYYDDGNATQRAINFVFNNDDSYLYIYKKKPSDIFFEGPFIPNGISRSFLNLMSSLKNSDKNITVLINGSDIAQDHKRILEFSKLPSTVTVLSRVGRTPMTLEEIWVRNKFEETFQFYTEPFKNTLIKVYKREARRLLGDTKFLNAIHFEGYALFWVLLFSQINAKQHIIYQHNDKYKEWKGRFPYLEGVFNSYLLYDKIVSVSEKTMGNNIYNLSEKFKIDQNKFTFCNNPINVNQIMHDADKEIEMESEFKNFKGIKFINIGRMSHEKDHLKLIDAFSEVHKIYKNTRLFILGDGPLKSELLKKISQLSLKKSVYLLGQKNNPFPYLKQSDAFVLSSNHEGQPMVLLESLTLGTSIIATDIVGNRGILSNKYGLLVENSKDGLVNGMISYVENGMEKDNFDPYEYQINAINRFNHLLVKG